MTDPLTTGSTRLADWLVPCEGVSVGSDPPTGFVERAAEAARQHRAKYAVPGMAKDIAKDPGVVALVELVDEMCSMARNPSRDFWQSSAKIARKKWETGE